jgi:hypothetical protein
MSACKAMAASATPRAVEHQASAILIAQALRGLCYLKNSGLRLKAKDFKVKSI